MTVKKIDYQCWGYSRPMRVLALAVVLAALLAAPAGAAGGYPNVGARCRATGAVSGACPQEQWGYRSRSGVWTTISRRGFDYRNCTDYVAWRLGLTYRLFHFSGRGNASLWRAHAAWIGRVVRHSPRVGDIAWWPATAAEPEGHVALVVALGPSGTARVAEYNWDGLGRYDVRTTFARAYLHRVG